MQDGKGFAELFRALVGMWVLAAFLQVVFGLALLGAGVAVVVWVLQLMGVL